MESGYDGLESEFQYAPYPLNNLEKPGLILVFFAQFHTILKIVP